MRFFLVLILFVLSCSSGPEITIYTNVNGYTLTESNEAPVRFNTLVFADGKVVETGDEAIADKYDGIVIDGQGKTLLPGLIDAHGHVMQLGFQQLEVDLSGINSLEETLNTIEAYAEANPDLEWILGRGWNQTRWEDTDGGFPTAQDLDKVVDDRPVWLNRVDGHAGWGNTETLKRAGVSKDTPDPQGGKIIRDNNGNATGVFVDAAEGYVTAVLPEYGDEEYAQALEKALDQMGSVGLTGAHDAGINVRTWKLYKDFADAGKMTTRIYAMIGGAGSVFDTLSADGPISSYADDRLALRSVKLYSDGALGSRGAAMIEPYSDDPGNTGLLFVDQQEMNSMVSKVMGSGFQANVHAIGDMGNRQVLNAFEYSKSQHGDQGLRNRIEHAQIVAPEDIPRFKELDIIASMQPTHATSDKNMAVDRVGEERIKGAYAWNTFLEQGTVVAGGSDFPVEHSNPFFGLYSAVTRMDHDGNPPEGWYPEEALDRVEAFRAFTLDAAYAGHQEEKIGSLEEGKWADFILVDTDYFEAPVSELWKIKVLETWVAGEKVYQQ